MTEDISKQKRKAKFILQDLDIREVSLVSAGAIGKTYLLTKAADDIPIETLPDVEVVEVDKEVDLNAGTVPATKLGANAMNEKLLELLKSVESEDIRKALTGALDTILTNKEAVPEDVMKGFYEMAGYTIPTIEKEVEKIVEKEVIREVEKIVEVEVEKAEDPKEAILKGLDGPTLALFKEQQEKIDKSETEKKAAVEKAAAEEQARIGQEYVQKATKDWSKLPFEAAALGPVLKAVAEKLDKSESEVVMKVFKAATGAIVATKQDEEFGNAGDSGGSAPEDKYEPVAKAMVADGKAATYEQAVAELVRTQPELFTEE